MQLIYEKIFERLVKKELDESTAGADASVEMPKLHNIKLFCTLSVVKACPITQYASDHIFEIVSYESIKFCRNVVS